MPYAGSSPVVYLAIRTVVSLLLPLFAFHANSHEPVCREVRARTFFTWHDASGPILLGCSRELKRRPARAGSMTSAKVTCMRMERRRKTEPAGHSLTYRGTLAPPRGYESLVTAVMSANGPVAIWASAAGNAELSASTESPGFATFPKSVPDVAQSVALAAYTQDVELRVVTIVEDLNVAHPFVEVLTDGSFLVVGARCYWRETGVELNAVVYDHTGRVVRRGCLGDGISHVQVAADGTIWVGYFDEGVFGNYGWGHPGPTPLGSGGIAAWTPELEKTWELDPSAGLVSDCYTLNLSQNDVLSAPYTDFPIVQIDAGTVTVTPTKNITGPKGIVRSGDRVALIGGYHDPGLLVVGVLAEGRFSETARMQLVTPSGDPAPSAPLHCRGSVAHLFAGTEWFSFDLSTMPT